MIVFEVELIRGDGHGDRTGPEICEMKRFCAMRWCAIRSCSASSTFSFLIFGVLRPVFPVNEVDLPKL